MKLLSQIFGHGTSSSNVYWTDWVSTTNSWCKLKALIPEKVIHKRLGYSCYVEAFPDWTATGKRNVWIFSANFCLLFNELSEKESPLEVFLQVDTILARVIETYGNVVIAMKTWDEQSLTKKWANWKMIKRKSIVIFRVIILLFRKSLLLIACPWRIEVIFFGWLIVLSISQKLMGT